MSFISLIISFIFSIILINGVKILNFWTQTYTYVVKFRCQYGNQLNLNQFLNPMIKRLSLRVSQNESHNLIGNHFNHESRISLLQMYIYML